MRMAEAFQLVTAPEKIWPSAVSVSFRSRPSTPGTFTATGELIAYRGLFLIDLQGKVRHALVNDLGEIDAREISSFPIADSDIVLRVGRYGPYIERGEERAVHFRMSFNCARNTTRAFFASEIFFAAWS